MQTQITSLANGVEYERLANGAVIAYRMTEFSNASYDSLVKAVQDSIAYLSPSRPYLALYDLTKMRTPNPYGRRQTLQLVRSLAHISGRYVLISPPTYIGAILRRLVFEELGKQSAAVVGRVVFSYDEALEWLLEALPKS